MRIKRTQTLTPACLLAVALLSLGAATASAAEAAGPKPFISTRAVTPQELKSLPGVQGATGLSTVGVGQPAYLEVLFDKGVTDITEVTWTLKSKPFNSAAELAESPLGAAVPTYSVSDRLVYQVAGRKMLRPDLKGQYTVEATIVTAGHGTTNLTTTVTAGHYLGVGTCILCHSGGQGAPNMVDRWAETRHATMFTRSIDGGNGASYNKNCISCHNTGYDLNTNAVNGGFDDVAKAHGWTFPTNIVAGNWTNVPSAVQKLANIQCESCHGPGSEHASTLGQISGMISVTQNSGNCAQCHDSMSHHFKNAEWNNSTHAIVTRSPSGPGREGCIKCHTGIGFAASVSGLPTNDPTYEPIGCAACHSAHDADNPHQLRTVAAVTLEDKKTVIENAGMGALCMNCHKARREAVSYVESTAGSTHFGPHYSTQTDMLAGANGYTYGKTIPSSAHKSVVQDTCVQCHMQEHADHSSPDFTHVGGHTFKLKTEINGTTYEMTESCKECHGEIETLNLVRSDYDGDGVAEGVQDEVHGLLQQLEHLMPPLPPNSSWTKQQLKAFWNYEFVEADGSFGVHNVSYAVGLLKASIADLTGDGNNDSLPDAWQVQHFGSAADPMAAPNATPANDGVPNWLKYSLGLDPKVAGMALPTGVVWANGKNVVAGPINPGDPNTVAIFTAAEVIFNSEVGKNYQIQAVSSLSGGWQNIGQPIAGTGASISYVTPTRNDAQQFYRVTVQ